MNAATVRPRLLFLCQTLPYPPDGGVWIRTYHVLRLLAREYDVTALCFERAATSGSRAGGNIPAGLEALSAFAHVEVFPIPQRHSRIRYVWDHVRSIARGRAYTEYLYESRTFRRRLTELLRSRTFDLVHADSLDMAGYFSACAGTPIACVHHNVESALLDRRADIERSGWRRAYLRHQARLTRTLERHWYSRVALNVTVSEEDRAAVTSAAPGVRTAVVPNGVDIDEFRPDGGEGRGVAYVGGTNWFPNLDALEFFAGQIWPLLRGRPECQARWIGSATPEQRQYYHERYDIELTGYVEDVRPFMRDAACHIVPLRAGGGTRLKILNSWAMGKPVVSSSVGCEGLAAVDGDNILIRDDPKEFAEAVSRVLEDRRLSRRLGERGRETAERLYAWDLIGRGMATLYRSVQCARAVRSDTSARRGADPASAIQTVEAR